MHFDPPTIYRFWKTFFCSTYVVVNISDKDDRYCSKNRESASKSSPWIPRFSHPIVALIGVCSSSSSRKSNTWDAIKGFFWKKPMFFYSYMCVWSSMMIQEDTETRAEKIVARVIISTCRIRYPSKISLILINSSIFF